MPTFYVLIDLNCEQVEGFFCVPGLAAPRHQAGLLCSDHISFSRVSGKKSMAEEKSCHRIIRKATAPLISPINDYCLEKREQRVLSLGG